MGPDLSRGPYFVPRAIVCPGLICAVLHMILLIFRFQLLNFVGIDQLIVII